MLKIQVLRLDLASNPSSPCQTANQVSWTTSSAVAGLRTKVWGQPDHRAVMPAHEIPKRLLVTASQT
jgi:hypothetical protein